MKRTLLALASCTVLAQEAPELESLKAIFSTPIITASKKGELELEVPTNIFVVSGLEMRARGYRTLFDLLQDIPGVLNYPHQAGEMFMGTPTVRGAFLPRRLKLMLNGMTVDPRDGSGTDWVERFPIEAIQRVEFIPGPYASMYGRNTFSGVLNVILKTGSTLEGGELNMLGGTYRQRQATLMGGTRRGSSDVLFSWFKNASPRGVDLAQDYPEWYSVAARKALGAVFSPGVPQDVVFPWDHDDAYLAWRLDRGLSLELHGNRARYGKNPTFSTLFYAAPEDSRVDERTLTGRIKYDVEPSRRFSSSTYVGFQRYTWEAQNFYMQGIQKYYTRESRALFLNEDLWYRFSPANALFMGVAYERVEFRPFAPTAATVAPAPYWAPFQANRFLNLTLQDEWSLSTAFKVVAGLMYERSNAYTQDVLMPRLACVWRPGRTTSVKLLYGRGYLTPSSEAQADQITPGGDMTKGTKNLTPEYITSWELTLTHATRSGLFLNLGLYRNQTTDIIRRVVDASLPAPYKAIYKNLGASDAYGADLLIKAPVATHGKLFFAYSFIQGSYDELGADQSLQRKDRLPVVANHHAKAGLEFPIGDLFQAYIHDLWFGDRVTYREERYGRYQFATPGFRLKGYNLVDVHLATTSAFSPRWRLSFTVNNLFDRKGFDPPYSEATTVMQFVPVRRRSMQFQVRACF